MENKPMPSLTSPFRRIARLVAEHVRRLRDSLVMLTAQVKSAVARVVGQATGNAVRDALTVVLDGPPTSSLPSSRDPPDDRNFWNDRRPSWSSQRHDDYEPYDERDRFEDEDDDPPTETTSDEPSGRWARAFGVGCQAASWFLRRHPGRGSVIAALGVGLAAGVAAFIGSPFITGTSAVVASALGVLSLADAACAAATLANNVMT
jgi:hypothetical protein